MSATSDEWKKRVSGTAHLLKGKSVRLMYDREFHRLAGDLGRVLFRQHSGEQGLDSEYKRLLGRMRDNRARRERDFGA